KQFLEFMLKTKTYLRKFLYMILKEEHQGFSGAQLKNVSNEATLLAVEIINYLFLLKILMKQLIE
ncbi:MAG: hypothetical protein ACRC4L_03060, partial [Mycoplasma sp.]